MLRDLTPTERSPRARLAAHVVGPTLLTRPPERPQRGPLRSIDPHRAAPLGCRYSRAALSSEVDRIVSAPTGFRHRTIFAAACHVGELVAGGELDETTAEGFLLHAGQRLTGGDLTVPAVRRAVRRGLDRGKQKPRTAPDGTGLRNRSEAVAEAIEWWSAVESSEWRGAVAGTTLRILAAFALLAVKAGKVRLQESYREVAEAAGVSAGTISKHRSRWLPWVRQVRVGNRFTGTRTEWQLFLRESGNTPASPVGRASGLFSDARTLRNPAHNLWHRWSNGWRIYCLLSEEEPLGVADLVVATGLHPSTIGRIGARLIFLGVAERNEDGWSATNTVDVEVLHHDGVDHAAQRRRRHQLDRLVHHRWQTARLRRERESGGEDEAAPGAWGTTASGTRGAPTSPAASRRIGVVPLRADRSEATPRRYGAPSGDVDEPGQDPPRTASPEHHHRG